MEIFQINRHDVMTYQNSPNMGRGVPRWWRSGGGGKAAESRSVYPGTCTTRSAENKIGFLLLVLHGGEGGGGGRYPYLWR